MSPQVIFLSPRGRTEWSGGVRRGSGHENVGYRNEGCPGPTDWWAGPSAGRGLIKCLRSRRSWDLGRGRRGTLFTAGVGQPASI